MLVCCISLIYIPLTSIFYPQIRRNVLSPVYEMKQHKLITNSTVFTPYTNGMDPPSFYQDLLKPFAPLPVQSLDDISSRSHIIPGVNTRCFDQLMVCNLVSLYRNTAHNPEGKGHTFWDVHPRQAGQTVVDYYKKTQPQAFPARKDGVFYVVIVVRTDVRRILNVDEVLKQCKAWKPPDNSPFKRTECITRETKPEMLIDDLGIVNRAHALVSTHGAQNAFVHTLQDGAALVEVTSWDFCGQWSMLHYQVSCFQV